jgi:hypothetical protein
MPIRNIAWTAEEDERLVGLRRRGESAKAIAALLNRTVKSVQARIADRGIKRDGTVCAALAAERRRKSRAAVRAWQLAHRATPVAAKPQPEPWQFPPPDTRDMTAFLCGDPLPGRSALDRRAA